ncbi:MAG: zinc ABC transporter substrate-binding protein [Verrucomicrobia bacterium]|nr:zinc ABC transporter substrate-binding protein [Verrucomicrobiota bacterium]
MKKHLLSLVTVTLALFASAAHGKLNVVATTPDFGALAKEIGGDRVDVTTLAKPTEDPHFVDAKPSFIVKLNHADALVEGGAELEIGWLPPLLEGARNTKLEAGKPGRILCNQGVAMLEVPTVLDRSKGDLHAAGNPHYTTDPLNGRIAAARIAEAFAQLDPKSADYFKANLKKFEDKLQAKLPEWQKLLAPFKGRRIVTYHNSWPYFAKCFELNMDLFLEPKPGLPPTPVHLAEVIAKMKAENIHLIVVEPHLNRKTAEAVAGHTDATLLDFAPYPNNVKGNGDTYIEWMDALVNSLAKTFQSAK